MEELGHVFSAAQELEAFCAHQKWRFCFIGGLAVQRWGEPRLTLDADLTLLTGFGKEEAFVDPLLGHFRESRPNARAFALQNRVLFIQASNNVRLDVALAAIGFEERCVARATAWKPLPNLSLTVCSAEDLIVHKAYADRERDWGDIESILIRQRGKLDMKFVFQELQPFAEAKETPEILERLRKMTARYNT